MPTLQKVFVRITSYNLGPKLVFSHLVVALTGTLAFVTVFVAGAGGESVAGRTLLVHVLPAAAAATASAVAASLFVARRILRPLKSIVEATRRVSSGRYEERVPVIEDDEIGELARSFNAMASALEDGERRRRTFVADVSHELRTPLSILGGYVDGLIDGVVRPDDGAWAPMHSETERMKRLVDDLQQLARAENGHLPLNVAPFSPEEVATLTVEGVRPLFYQKGVELEGPSVPCPSPVLPHALGDAQRVAQVLMNLLSNSLRHTGPGGRVRVEAEAREHEIVVAVRDTGSGIPREHLPRVFDRFYRVEASRSREDGGSGLGLAVSKALIESMGGRIWVESEGPSMGATFSFALPAQGARRRTHGRSGDRRL